jgi:hypothetical protein
MDGPFQPNIMPCRAIIRWDDVNSLWKVTASRYLTINILGRRYERMKTSAGSYEAILTALSFFWGNA